MKKTFCMAVIVVLFSQFAVATLYLMEGTPSRSPEKKPDPAHTDPNDPDFPHIVTDPNDPDYLDVTQLPSLPAGKDVAGASLDTMTLYAATELPSLKYRLLPVKAEFTDSDAALLYLKAIKHLTDPNEFADGQIEDWVKANEDKLDVDKVKPMLESLTPTIKLLTDAAYCRNCQWDQLKNIRPFQLSEGLKKLTQILSVKARYHIEKGQYEEAVDTIRTGLAMSRHIADSDSMAQGVTGAATASIMLKQIELMVQSPKAPCMLRPLQDLPRPLIDLYPAMQSEQATLQPVVDTNDFFYSSYRRKRFSSAYEKRKNTEGEKLPYSEGHISSLMARLDRFAAVLECFEGIRFYASKYGKLPKSLYDIDEFHLPVDPVTTRSFIYSNKDGRAVLRSPETENQAHRSSTIRYEIVFQGNRK